jgi:hypothetical protein
LPCLSTAEKKEAVEPPPFSSLYLLALYHR